MAGIVAQNYGEALFELAQESGREDRLRKSCVSWRNCLRQMLI